MAADSYLIETTILVDILHGKSNAIAWVDSLPSEARWVSVVTFFELLAGCRNRREQRAVTHEMRGYRLLLLTDDISRTALAWYERLHLSHGVGFLDSLIGATASQQGLPIATLNVKHFQPFPDLRVERPY